MCKQGNEKRIKLTDGRIKSCDECLHPLVQCLNDYGLQTTSSCCGHNKQPTRISLKDGREILVVDYDIATWISDLFPPLNPRNKEWKYAIRRHIMCFIISVFRTK